MIKFVDIYFTMNFNEHQRKISLLNQYSQCLQKQNNAKTIEINILHEQLNRIDAQNKLLRAELDAIKSQQMRIQHQTQTFIGLQNAAKQQTYLATHAQCQTEDDHEQFPQQSHVVFSLSSTIKEKDEIIAKYHSECQQMFEAIQKLQSSNKVLQQNSTKDKEILCKLQERVRKEEQKRHAAQERLQNISFNIYSAGEEVQNYKQRAFNLQKDFQQLITENNTLVERVRALQRQKNQYYHQIKRMSRVSFGGQGLGKSSVKKSRKVSDQRFKEIEEHLRKLQLQNEAIQSNLMIK